MKKFVSPKHNKKIIQLVGFQNNVLKLDTITPENIDNKIRSVTNATVLFSFKNEFELSSLINDNMLVDI